MKLFYIPLLTVFFLNLISIGEGVASPNIHEVKMIDEKEQQEGGVYSLNFKISP